MAQPATPPFLSGSWSYPTTIRFGAGRIAELPDACKTLGMARPLLVTDPGLSGLPMVASALRRNEDAALPTGLFSEVRGNPVGANVEAGVAAYRTGGHDGVIAFGGGSAMDAAKGIALMVGQDRPIWDFEDIGDNWTRANAEAIAPIVAVPTTAGTGSEVGRAGVIVNEATHTKVIVFHPRLLPGQVILDPELTIGLPPHVTAATGMDALAHNLEAFCAPTFHPMGEGIAVEGMRLVKEYLPRAVVDGTDIEARGHMLAAASMGTVAFQKGLGAIHSLSHPLGAVYDTHHGLTNAVVMPYVLDFNRPAIEEKCARLARWLDLPEAGFDGLRRWVLDLRAELGIPHTLAEIGVDDARIDEIARMATADPSAGTNPVPLDDAGHRAMLEAALVGRLA
ncbi:MAG: iron-containing alcohol dehydrogenase [Rhodospirillaceae bacterium]|jgi:alcohol dehydrogenase class IV|nr:iron-containing alcohol dehydrogenase [Rhodospirillaceae bacterium]MBT6116412.1 iron-containing alcohol dehydrogenase [Rhodospirillaceae bacterium]